MAGRDYRLGMFRIAEGVQISLLVWAWLANVAKAQDIGGAISSTVSFLDAGLTTLGHIAAFANCFLRGRLDVEMASRDLLISLSEEKLLEVSGSSTVSALSTTDEISAVNVVLMTTNIADPVMRSFMKHVAACYDIHGLVVSCLPLRKVAVTVEECVCNERCSCLCLWSTPEITKRLALRLPGNMKQVSSELYLVPSYPCFKAGCHGCNHDMLYVGPTGLSNGPPDTAVVGALSVAMHVVGTNSPLCLAVPSMGAVDDHWSRLLLRLLRSRDEAERDLQMDAVEALDLYSRGQSPVGPSSWSLGKFSFLLPRLMEMVLNVVLTGFFRVDGFSSALVCRRTVRDYLVNSIGNGLHANVFLSYIHVSAHSTFVHICQSLRFRAAPQSLRSTALAGASVNAICTIWWIAAVCLHRGLGSWSSTYTRPPTLLTLCVLIAGIGIALAMDSTHAYLNRSRWRTFPLLWAAMVVETLVLITLASVLGAFGVVAVSGTWIYGVVQALAWGKWLVGSLLLGSDVITPISRDESGAIVYSSSFLLTAILAAVGGNWK